MPISTAERARKRFILPRFGARAESSAIAKVDFEDDAVGICAGLWNFALSY
jgi:hypothetical protein